MVKLPNFYIPQCQDALLLVNSRALFLYERGGIIHDNPIPENTNRYNVDRTALLRFAHRELKIAGDPHNYRLLSHYWVEWSGQIEYLFTVVGCGKCWLCTNSKRVDLINRAMFESQLYDCPPMFITLTYDDAHLPRNGSVVSYNLRYTDVQKFFKRLRKRFASKGLATDFRYLVAGEYGKDTHRPHYHFIMWNNPYHCNEFQPHLMAELKRDIFESWNMCAPWSFDFGQCAGGAAHYVTKYLTKQVHYSDRQVQPFVHTSIGHGGIGSQFLRDRVNDYRDNPNLSAVQFTSLDGVFHESSFGSYAKNVFHPSPSRLVPPVQKQLFHEFCSILSMLYRSSLIDVDTMLHMVEDNRPFPSGTSTPILFSGERYSPCPTFGRLLVQRCRKVLQLLHDSLDLVSDVDGHDIQSYNDYLYRLCEFPDIRDQLSAKSYRIAEKFADELNRQKL